MRLIHALLASTVAATATAQLIAFTNPPSPNKNVRLAPPSDRLNQQQAMADLPSGKVSQEALHPTGAVILSDVIGSQRSINIFAGFTRDISSISSRLDTSGSNTTVLAPLNSAISDLPRKPWEDPRDYQALGTEAYEGKEGEDRAHRNLRRFTEAHVVPVSPWEKGKKVETLGGGTVWWESRGDKTVIMPGEVEVEKVASQVHNGEVWILKGVVNYA